MASNSGTIPPDAVTCLCGETVRVVDGAGPTECRRCRRQVSVPLSNDGRRYARFAGPYDDGHERGFFWRG